MSSFHEEFQRKQRLAKEQERERKKMATQAQNTYRGTAASASDDSDLQLRKLKEQDRVKKEEAKKINQSFQGNQASASDDSDLQLRKLKEQDRIKKEEAKKINQSFQGNLSVEEIQAAQAQKVAARQKEVEHKKVLNSFKAK